MIHQLFTRPTHPSLRQLYLGANVSEITALCLEHLLHEAPPASPGLRQRDIDNLQLAISD